MRNFWFGTKLAAAFSLVGLFILASTGTLARYTVGEQFHEHAKSIRAAEAVVFAQEIEGRLTDKTLDSTTSEDSLRRVADEGDRDLAYLDDDGATLAATSRTLEAIDTSSIEEVPCGTRTCKLVMLQPGRLVLAPIVLNDRELGWLAVSQGLPEPGDFVVFGLGLVIVYLVALVIIIGLSIRITRPLRHMSASMDHIASGEIEHRVAVKGRDEVARMGESFNAMADRVSRMITGSKELLAGVSHELRSPLGRIKLSLEMLREAGAQEKHLSSIEEDIDALDGMVDELLTASRLDLGTATIKRESVALEELIEHGRQRLSTFSQPVDVDIDLEPADLRVDVDRALGTRLIGNLLENAARYGERSPVFVKARLEGSRAVVEVEDRGPGVPEESLVALFQPFFRADTSRSRRTGGAGLGLMIVRRAVEAHGGSVSAANADEGGLVVTLDLPVG